MFVLPAPLLLKQCYLVVTGVATAYVFTWIPEWTTWVMLLCMALYDVVAGARGGSFGMGAWSTRHGSVAGKLGHAQVRQVLASQSRR